MYNINTVPWNAAYGLVSVSTIVCNLLFLFVAFKSKRLRHMRITLFLIGLTTADLIVGAVAIPMYMAILWVGSSRAFFLSWILTEVGSSLASLFLLAVIALERVYSVFWPYRHRALSKTPYYLALFTSWCLAVLQITLVLLKWEYNLIEPDPFIYCVFPSMTAVVIIIIVSYFAMWIKIKTSRMEGLHQRRDEQERKLAKTLAILTGIFLIAMIPFYVGHVLVIFCRSCSFPLHLTCAVKLLHYSNSLANPVVYSFRFPEVRGTLAKIFCRREQIVAPTDLQIAVRGGQEQ